jgi:hypothetical protein
MSERKIRLTLSSTIVNNVGALIDVDFNGENLDVDVEIAAERGVSSLVKEYTVDVTSGTYNLDLTYKNDMADDLDNDSSFETDRNLIIEKIEFSNDGVNYEPLIVNSANTNLELNLNFNLMGWLELPNPNYNPAIPRSQSNARFLQNPDFSSELPQTDSYDNGYVDLSHPGTNSMVLYELVIGPVTVFNSSTATFQISFS